MPKVCAASWTLLMLAPLALACSFNSSGSSRDGGGPGGPGGAGPGTGPGTGPGQGPGPGPGGGPPGGGNGTDAGVVMCVPGVARTAVTDCGYPYTSSTQLTSVVFNEPGVLRSIEPAGGTSTAIVRLFYNDEHALTLGVRSVVVKTTTGTTTTDYPVSPLLSNPGTVTSAQLGTTALVGDQSGLDASLRPMWPVLFITDVTSDPSSRAGDWQMGGVPHAPTAVFGTWKAAVRTVDRTVSPNTVTITPDADPAKNNWNLGSGSDTVPSGLANEGFGAEVRWDVALAAGRSYRIQVMVHDGDQNKAGGDSGEACVVYCSGGGGGEGGGTGGSSGGGGGTPTCPANYPACGSGGIEPISCPSGTVCANGCCLPNGIVP